MHNVKKILNTIFPFAITILLWRMSAPVWNPNGVLALVPIFYYSFTRPRSEFMPMAVAGCLLLDYNFGTTLFWTSLFCASYAAIHLQTVTKPFIAAAGGLLSFSVFLGAGVLILAILAFSWASLGTALWIFLVGTAAFLVWIRVMGKIK